MVKFFKASQEEHAQEALALELELPGKIKFSNSIDQNEEVIIVSSFEDGKEANNISPESRVIYLVEDDRKISPKLAHELGLNVIRYAGKNDPQKFIDLVKEQYQKKKPLAFYVNQEKAEALHARSENGFVQLDGLVNKHLIGKSQPVIKTLQALAMYKKYMERLGEKNPSSLINILITGENGTGKGQLAKVWFDNFPKKKNAQHNIAGYTNELFTSKLFGHKKGAFTGAHQDEPGILKTNNGGIVFIDEIGDSSLYMQQAMLRLAQEKEYEPLGTASVEKFNGQLLWGTNKDLNEAIKQGTFREDFYHRIESAQVHLAPLRERREDIPLLIDSFLATYGTGQSITLEAVDLMKGLHWPGNIRQLENFTKDLCIFEEGVISSDLVRQRLLDKNDRNLQYKNDLNKVHAVPDVKIDLQEQGIEKNNQKEFEDQLLFLKESAGQYLSLENKEGVTNYTASKRENFDLNANEGYNLTLLINGDSKLQINNVNYVWWQQIDRMKIPSVSIESVIHKECRAINLKIIDAIIGVPASKIELEYREDKDLTPKEYEKEIEKIRAQVHDQIDRRDSVEKIDFLYYKGDSEFTSNDKQQSAVDSQLLKFKTPGLALWVHEAISENIVVSKALNNVEEIQWGAVVNSNGEKGVRFISHSLNVSLEVRMENLKMVTGNEASQINSKFIAQETSYDSSVKAEAKEVRKLIASMVEGDPEENYLSRIMMDDNGNYFEHVTRNSAEYEANESTGKYDLNSSKEEGIEKEITVEQAMDMIIADTTYKMAISHKEAFGNDYLNYWNEASDRIHGVKEEEPVLGNNQQNRSVSINL